MPEPRAEPPLGRVLPGALALGGLALALRLPALALPFVDLSGWVLVLAGALLGPRRGMALGAGVAALAWAGGAPPEFLALVLFPGLGALWQARLCEAVDQVPRPLLAGLLGAVLAVGAPALAALRGALPPQEELVTRGILGFLLYGMTLWWVVTPVDELREAWRRPG